MTAAEKRLADATAAVEGTIRSFGAALGDDLKAWIPGSIRKQTRDQDAVTTARGKPGIEALKKDLDAFVVDIPAFIENDIVGSSQLWKFRAKDYSPGETWSLPWHGYDFGRDGKSVPMALKQAVDTFLRVRAGEVLRKHGYSLRRDHASRAEYPEPFPWSDALNSSARPLASQLKEFDDAHRAVTATRSARSKAIATDLWDQT